MNIPQVWHESGKDYIRKRLELEAERRSCGFGLPTETLEEWRAYRTRLRKKIWQKLGVSHDPGLPLEIRETGMIKLNGYAIRKLWYQSRPGVYVTANLYVPDGDGPFPAVLNMHGHWQQGKIAADVQARGHQLALNGYVCLTPDTFGLGERSSSHCCYEHHGRMLGASLFLLGETPMGCQVVDNMRGLDLLCSLPYVDKQKIGATGASGGGNQTMWLTALDDRVAAAVPVVSVGTFQSYIYTPNCVCELLPDGMELTNEAGILALAAPRALKMLNALQDACRAFLPEEMLRSYQGARPVYQLFEADNKFSYQIFNRPHGYFPEMREAMLGWFNLHLKGEGTGASITEKPFETLPEESLLVFPPGHRSPKVIGIAAYCRRRGKELQKNPGEKSPAIKRAELRKLLRLQKLSIVNSRESTAENGWRKVTLELSNGTLIPLRILPGSSQKMTILAHPDSSDKIPEALYAGGGVAVVDLSGSGETVSEPDTIQPYFQRARSELWLGRTLPGEWTAELLAVIGFLRQSYPSVRLGLHGFRESAVASLFAAVFDGKITRVTLEDAPKSFLFHGDGIPTYFNMSLVVPGIIPWGDMKLAVRLAEIKVRFIRPRYMDGKLLEAESIYQHNSIKIEKGAGHRPGGTAPSGAGTWKPVIF